MNPRSPNNAAAGDATDMPLLRMRGVEKSFLGVQVLHGVDLDLHVGSIHALVGENGAGKSTLMKILAGVYRADAGAVTLSGQQVDFEHPLQAQRAGVSTVFQECNLLPDRSVAENVFLGREPRTRGLVNVARMNADTAALLEGAGIRWLSPQLSVRSLSVADQQIVEIVKALSYDARIICLDEPTAALAGNEVELLHRLVRRLQNRGVAILYVSHRLREVFDLCDRVTVLKDGTLVDSVATQAIDTDELVRMMVGRPVSRLFPPKLPGTRVGDIRLRVRGGGNENIDSIDLDLRAGEITGLAGLQGSGRTELAHALFGIARFTRGTVQLDGRPTRLRSPRSATRAGMALVSEDRKTEGLVLNQSILANARLVLDAARPRRAQRRATRLPDILSSLDLVARGPDQEVRFLSGGNQQKVVLAKWLATEPSIVVFDEPTRGIDIGAKNRVHAIIRKLAEAGVAVLMISSELQEVIGMADRILVMHEGRIAGELTNDADAPVTEQRVMALATGHGASMHEVSL